MYIAKDLALTHELMQTQCNKDLVSASDSYYVAFLHCVCTSTSRRLEAASIPFALHENLTGSGSKVGRFNAHVVG